MNAWQYESFKENIFLITLNAVFIVAFMEYNSIFK